MTGLKKFKASDLERLENTSSVPFLFDGKIEDGEACCVIASVCICTQQSTVCSGGSTACIMGVTNACTSGSTACVGGSATACNTSTTSCILTGGCRSEEE